jgi:hypothetical protein
MQAERKMLLRQLMVHGTHFSAMYNFQGKVKVAPLLFLTEHHAMMTYRGIGGTAPLIL